MKTITDQSYGVIPVINVDGAWQVFLIHQYGSAGDVFWTFPKGHPEAHESPEASARRELFEETGLSLKELRTDTPLTQSYRFVLEGTQIEKTVTYFIGVAARTDFTIQVQEVKEAGWFTFADANDQLSYDSARAVLADVATLLSS